MHSTTRHNLLNLLPEPSDRRNHPAVISEWDLSVSNEKAGLVLIVGLSGSGRGVVGQALAEALGCVDWESLSALRRYGALGGLEISQVTVDDKPLRPSCRLYVGEIRTADLETLKEMLEFIERGGQVVAEMHAARASDAMRVLRKIYSTDATCELFKLLEDLLQQRSDAFVVGLRRQSRGGAVYVERRFLSEMNLERSGCSGRDSV